MKKKKNYKISLTTHLTWMRPKTQKHEIVKKAYCTYTLTNRKANHIYVSTILLLLFKPINLNLLITYIILILTMDIIEAFRIYSKEGLASNPYAWHASGQLSPFLQDCYSTLIAICVENLKISVTLNSSKLYKHAKNKKINKSLMDAYTGKANERVLVVLLSDLRERLPEYAIGPE